MSSELVDPRNDEIDLVDAVLAVWKRRWLALATFMIVALVGIFFAFNHTAPDRQVRSQSGMPFQVSWAAGDFDSGGSSLYGLRSAALAQHTAKWLLGDKYLPEALNANIARSLEKTQSREITGHWEGDLITGAYNGSAIGSLVGRTPASSSWAGKSTLANALLVKLMEMGDAPSLCSTETSCVRIFPENSVSPRSIAISMCAASALSPVRSPRTAASRSVRPSCRIRRRGARYAT